MENVAMQEDTFQQRHGDMENEETTLVFEVKDQLESHSGKYFH